MKIANLIVNKSSKTTKIDSNRFRDEAITNKITPNIKNEYFCNIGNTLKENITYRKYFVIEGADNINFSSEIFTFSEISEEEVMLACFG